MRTRNVRPKVLFGTNYPMIFHEPALADLDALALDDEARELYNSANAQRLFKGEPRACFAAASGRRAGRRVWCPQRTTSTLIADRLARQPYCSFSSISPLARGTIGALAFVAERQPERLLATSAERPSKQVVVVDTVAALHYDQRHR